MFFIMYGILAVILNIHYGVLLYKTFRISSEFHCQESVVVLKHLLPFLFNHYWQ